MTVALKSLSNIGQITPEFEESLQKMIEDQNLEPKLRVAAVDVYRRLPCHEYRSYFEKVFRNMDHDVEVRIASYLQVMRCPTYVTIRTIKHSLETEEVNQGKYLSSASRFMLSPKFNSCTYLLIETLFGCSWLVCLDPSK